MEPQIEHEEHEAMRDGVVLAAAVARQDQETITGILRHANLTAVARWLATELVSQVAGRMADNGEMGGRRGPDMTAEDRVTIASAIEEWRREPERAEYDRFQRRLTKPQQGEERPAHVDPFQPGA